VDDARAWETFCGRDTSFQNNDQQALPIWFSKIQHLGVCCGFYKCTKLYEERLTDLTALKTLSIIGNPCPAHTEPNDGCGWMMSCKTLFTERLESKWEQDLGPESKESLPQINFVTWSKLEECSSRQDVRLSIDQDCLRVSTLTIASLNSKSLLDGR